MDSPANDLALDIAAPPPENLDLVIHKQKLRAAAASIDFLKPLRRHPFVTVSVAASMGMVVATPGAGQAMFVSGTAPIKRRITASLINYLLRYVMSQFRKPAAAEAAQDTPA